MSKAYIGVGSNIEPEENVRRALRLLSREVRITGISVFYRTKAEGRPDQPDFINGVVEVETDIRPMELKRSVLRRIEDELGRRRTEDRYAPRTIDLDLIMCDGLVLQSDELVLPDPAIRERPFLAIPLAELAPDMVLPGTDTVMLEVAATLDQHGMEPLNEYTGSLRKDISHEPREDRAACKRAAD